MEDDEIADWLEHIRTKYQDEFRAQSRDEKLISESDRILRQFGIHPTKMQKPKRKPVKFVPPKMDGFHVNTVLVTPESYKKQEKNEDQELDALIRELQEKRDSKKAKNVPQQKRRPLQPVENRHEPAAVAGKPGLVRDKKEKQSVRFANEKEVAGKRDLKQSVRFENAIEGGSKKPEVMRSKSEKQRVSREKDKTSSHEKHKENESVKKEEELRKKFVAVVNRRRRKALRHWRCAAENLKEGEVQVELMHNLAVKRRIFAKLATRAPRMNLKPRFDEMERMKQLEALGSDYAKHLFWTRYLGLWVSRYNARKSAPSPECDRQRPLRKKRPQRKKITFKRYEFIKKPPLPPIVPDPIGEEMLKKAVGVREKKVQEIKKQMRADRQAKKEQEERQKAIAEQKRQAHRRDLARQKQARIAQCQAEANMVRERARQQQLEGECEILSNQRILRRTLQSWTRILSIRDQQIDEFLRRARLARLWCFFHRMRYQLQSVEHARESSAVVFNRRRLFAKVVAGIRVARQQIAEHEQRVAHTHYLHTQHHWFQEWKSARMFKKRQMKMRAVEAYQKHLRSRALEALRVGLANIAESKQRRAFRNKLLNKAKEFLGNLVDTSTFQADGESF